MTDVIKSIAQNDVRKKLELLAAAANASPSFRAQLLADGRKAIEDFFAVSLPDGVAVRVIEDDEETLTVVLPPVPSKPVKQSAINVHQLAGYVGAAYSSIIQCPSR